MKKNYSTEPWWLTSNEKYFVKYGTNEHRRDNLKEKEGKGNLRTKMQKIEPEDLEEKTNELSDNSLYDWRKIKIGLICIGVILVFTLIYLFFYHTISSSSKELKPHQNPPLISEKFWCNIFHHSPFIS